MVEVAAEGAVLGGVTSVGFSVLAAAAEEFLRRAVLLLSVGPPLASIWSMGMCCCLAPRPVLRLFCLDIVKEESIYIIVVSNPL